MADVLGRLKASTEEELLEVAQMLNLLAVDVTKAKAEGRAPQVNPWPFALGPQSPPRYGGPSMWPPINEGSRMWLLTKDGLRV